MSKAQEIQKQHGLKYQPSIYRNEALARSALSHYVKPHRIILGNCPEFWIVCHADAERLLRAGYEMAV